VNCRYCGEANSRTHVTNKYPTLYRLRARRWKDFDELKKGDSLDRGEIGREPGKSVF